jgi:predicted dehydrogenase
MNVLVVGFGSIGARHARILTEMGHNVKILTRQNIFEYPIYQSMAEAVDNGEPEYVVIANQTRDHLQSLKDLQEMGYSGRVLVEKPLDLSPVENLEFNFASLHVGYNLRFHPLIIRLKTILQDKLCYSAFCYAGQYLPSWRQNTNYASCYSNHKCLGGGVLRDLSHEIDYLVNIFGRCQSIYSLGGHLSCLEGDSDDIYASQIKFQHCRIAQLQVNYLDKPGRRFLIVNWEGGTICVNLVSCTIDVNGCVTNVEVPRNETYRLMHSDILQGGQTACTFSEANYVLRVIDAAEKSTREGRIECNLK